MSQAYWLPLELINLKNYINLNNNINFSTNIETWNVFN